MKTILFILVAASISFGAVAQNLEVKPMPKIDFNKGWQKDTTLTFKNTPPLKLEIPDSDPGISQHGQKQYKFPGTTPQNTRYSSLAFQFKMPVVGDPYPSRMPVMVPDSTVHYFLRIKRIPFDNPLDKRWK